MVIVRHRLIVIRYMLNISVGTPSQQMTVQLDTGSSDLWILSTASDLCLENQCAYGAFDPQRSSSLQSNVIEAKFESKYADGSGSSGSYISDNVGFGSVNLKNVTMGLATISSIGYGLMGVGYDSLEMIADDDPSAEYPNIINDLKSQGVIKSLAYSLWLNDIDAQTGSILFGGVDTAKFDQPLTVIPVQKNQNGNYSDFTVVLSSITVQTGDHQQQYNSGTLNAPVVLDSGTSNSYIPQDIAREIQRGVGAVDSEFFQGPILPCSFGQSSDVIQFTFGGPGGPTINVPLDSFLVPQTNEYGVPYRFPGSKKEEVCGWGLNGVPPTDVDGYVLGDSFLRGAYVVYDIEHNQIGLAHTNFNATGTNVVEISGSAIPSAVSTFVGTTVVQTATGAPSRPQASSNTVKGQVTVGFAQPTFNLQLPSSVTSNGKSAGTTVAPPSSISLLGVTLGMTVAASLVFGSALMAWL